jgi:hypothetical protein
MKKLALFVFVALCGCAHVYKTTSDCDGIDSGPQKLACQACTVQNKAEGWLGTWEYRPDNKEGERCVRAK